MNRHRQPTCTTCAACPAGAACTTGAARPAGAACLAGRVAMRTAAALVLGGLVAACTPTDMPEPPEGRALFQTNCVICHGRTGIGDGELAADLNPAPADLTQIAARNGGVFPKARVLSGIDGYTRAEKPGQDMPEFGLLLRGDTVPVDTGDGVLSPTPRPLAALLVYLQSIQR